MSCPWKCFTVTSTVAQNFCWYCLPKSSSGSKTTTFISPLACFFDISLTIDDFVHQCTRAEDGSLVAVAVFEHADELVMVSGCNQRIIYDKLPYHDQYVSKHILNYELAFNATGGGCHGIERSNISTSSPSLVPMPETYDEGWRA